MKIAFFPCLAAIGITFASLVQAEIPAASPTLSTPDTALKISDGQSIAFLGASITQFGWDSPGGYLHLVVEGLKSVGVTIKPFPAGVSGQTSRDMVKRVQQSVVKCHPTWMALSCGINDVWHKAVDLDEYKKNITSIVDQAQAAGIKVMIVTETPIFEDPNNEFNQRLAPENDFLRQLAKQRNLLLVDMYSIFQEKQKSMPPPVGDIHPLTIEGVHLNPEGNFLFARGILEALGLTPAQLAAYEAQWRQSDHAAGIYGGMVTGNGVPISPEEDLKIRAAAEAQKMQPGQLEVVICYRALMVAVKAHEKEPEFSPALRAGTITPEMNQDILKIVDAFPSPPPGPTAAAPTPPPATPSPATPSPATPPIKPKGPHFGAFLYMAKWAPVSLPVYNNILATAQAQHVSLNKLIEPLFFQAVRNAVKTMGDQEATLTYDQARNHFQPLIYHDYADVLKSFPPTATGVVQAPAAKPSTAK